MEYVKPTKLKIGDWYLVNGERASYVGRRLYEVGWIFYFDPADRAKKQVYLHEDDPQYPEHKKILSQILKAD
jgi:hypothetical protein